eukprot:4023756-Amphidinium_carterae.1
MALNMHALPTHGLGNSELKSCAQISALLRCHVEQNTKKHNKLLPVEGSCGVHASNGNVFHTSSWGVSETVHWSRMVLGSIVYEVVLEDCLLWIGGHSTLQTFILISMLALEALNKNLRPGSLK